jgi:hypothetical protein
MGLETALKRVQSFALVGWAGWIVGDSSAWLRMTIQKDVMIASKPNPVLGQP